MRERAALKETLRAGKEQQSPRKRMCRRPASVNSGNLKKFMSMEANAVNFGESQKHGMKGLQKGPASKNQWITETRAVAKELITNCSFSQRDEKTSHEEFQIKSSDNRAIRAETSSNSRHSVFTHLYAQPSFKHTATR